MTTDVIIVGCGPTGAVLANLLGIRGMSVVVLERDAEVFPLPRATHIDAEAIRILTATGLWDAIEPHTAPFGPIEIFEETVRLLRTDLPEGDRIFAQPAREAELRRGLDRGPAVQLRNGVTVDAVGQDATGAWARVGDEVIRGRYLVGCDGGRSRVRAQIGAEMRELHPAERWVIVDGFLNDPADLARLPDCFRYVFQPDRTRILVHGMGTHRRWEFSLREGEVEPSRETVLGWVADDVPLDRIDVQRVQTYHHRALVAEHWRQERIFLAGDAAHMMPPTAGQGMCAGLRDAVELAYQLERGTPQNYPVVRDANLRKTVSRTMALSGLLSAKTRLGSLLRRHQLGIIGRFPRLQDAVRRLLPHPAPSHALVDAEARFGGL
jgi:3-(3-hydroxy-phenyl)propionate hydroxylase